MTIKYNTLVICCLALMLGSSAAHASDWHRLAYSKKMGAEVFVDQTGGAWCRQSVRAKVHLSDSSPLLGGEVESFLQKVGPVIQKDCTSATGARFDIYRNDGKTLISTYTSTASEGWQARKSENVGTSLDDVAASSPDTSPPPAPEAPAETIEPVPANYSNLVTGVLPTYEMVTSDEQVATDYLKLKQCKEYRKYSANEIQLAKLKQHHAQDMKDFWGTPIPSYLAIQFEAKLGQYDIKRGAFSFTPLESDAAFVFKRPNNWDCELATEIFPYRIRLNIHGGEFIKEISMPADKAERLIKELRRRDILVHVTLKTIGSSPKPEFDDAASVDTVLYSMKIINERTKKPFYEFPQSWLGPKVAEKQALMAQEAARKEQEKLARADRIERGVEPLEIDGAVAYAHYDKLSSPRASYMVDSVDTRRPVLIKSKARIKNGLIFPDGEPPISFSIRPHDKSPIYVLIQNWRDFTKQEAPQGLDEDITKQIDLFGRGQAIQVSYETKPIGYMDDPYKGGKGLVVYASSAKYAARRNNGSWEQWEIKAQTPELPFVQKHDSRSARELDIAGLHGGMTVDDVQNTLEDKLQLETTFNENVKTLSSQEQITVSDFFDAQSPGAASTPGKRSFEGVFVQTGKSLFGMGAPIYSLKQAVLKQTATAKEKDAIVEGLIKKFGEPDLRINEQNKDVYTWGKRITDDRSQMPEGKRYNLPVSAVEAQIYHNENAVLTILILTDDLYLKKTNVTTKTIY